MFCMRIFTLSCVLTVISGYCYTQGFNATYCTAVNGITIPLGAELDFKDKCEKCSCYSHPETTTSYMSCCGYGFALAGVMAPPKECKFVKGEDGCSIETVRIDDETKPCN